MSSTIVDRPRALVARVWPVFADAVGQIATHWFVFVLLVVVPWLAVWGWLMPGFGLPLLLREDPALFRDCLSLHMAISGTSGQSCLKAWLNSPALYTHASTTFFAGMFWMTAAILDHRRDEQFMAFTIREEWQYILARTMPISAIMLWSAVYPISPALEDMGRGEFGRSVAGILLALPGIAFFTAFSRMFSRMTGLPRRYVLYIMLALFIILLHFIPRLLAIVSIFKLSATICGLYLLLNFFSERKRAWVFLAVVVLPVVVGSLKTYKYMFPGMEHLYANPVQLKDRLGGLPEQPLLRPGATTGTGSAAARSKPVAALQAFDRSLPAAQKPPNRRLVVIATSGGAYRATFWTALVLDRLIKSSKDGTTPSLARHIRLLTGASGGMVGAAYFATLAQEEIEGTSEASLVRIIETDISNTQRAKAIPLDQPLPRDTLTDVLQQLVAFDILHIALPMTFGSVQPRSNPVGLDTDRGRVLQSHWPRIGQSFESLHRRVMAGVAPSIIFSPMLVETGQPLLISDLDLADIAVSTSYLTANPGLAGSGGITSHTLEMFNVFPSTFDRFTLQTAARMNAAFPVFSPAVDLPTDPPRRIVDAGYFDNYGMATALAYLKRSEIRAWMHERNLAGAIIVQINAFPVLGNYDRPSGKLTICDDDQPSERHRSLQWLTTPLEGLTAARERSMVYRGEQELEVLKSLYRKDNLDLERVFFENTSRSSFSWYLPQKDLDCMARELDKPHNLHAMSELGRVWRSSPPKAN